MNVRSISPLKITYTGILKSMKTYTPFEIISIKRKTQESVFNIAELRSSLNETPKTSIIGTPSVTNDPAVITHFTCP